MDLVEQPPPHDEAELTYPGWSYANLPKRSEGSAGGYPVVGVRICGPGVQNPQGGAPQPPQDPKQPPSHMHQQQIHQGPPMPITYAPQAPSRPNYYPSARGPPPRIPRPSMVTMSMPNVPYMPSSQLYSPSPQVMATNMPLMFANQVPVPLAAHGGRQQNHSATAGASPGFFMTQAPPQSLIMGPPYSTNYYIPPPLRNTNAYQTTPAQSAPAQQPPPPQQQQVMSGGGGVGGNVAAGGGRQKRKHAVKIVDPATGKDVVEEMLHTEETASQSGDSSTSHTPQPQGSDIRLQQSGGDAILVAEFAARVAAAASDEGETVNGSEAVVQPVATGGAGKPLGGEERPTPVVSALTDSPPVELHHHRAPSAPLQTPPQPKKLPPPPAVVLPPVPTPVPAPQQPIVVPVPVEEKKPSPPPRAPLVRRSPSPPPPPTPAPAPEGEEESPVGPPTPLLPRPQPEAAPAPAAAPPPPRPVSAPPRPSAFADSFDIKNMSTLVIPPPHEEKRPNGETSEAFDAKASQRQKHKRQAKLRDLNRKGVEKEGTDMDAFTEPPAVVASAPAPAPAAAVAAVSAAPLQEVEEQERPAVEEEPPAASVPSPPLTPPPPPTPEERPPTPLSPQSVQDPQDIDQCEEEEVGYDEEEEEDDEDAMVAVKNEENAKVSALVGNKVIETQIIERSTPQLKYSYKDGQWSPVNLDGKKVYGRDFLMDLRNDPLSSRKPDITLDCEILVKDRDISNNNRRSIHNQAFSSMSMSKSRNSFAPEFFPSSPSQRGMPPKRNSQQGSRPGGGGRKPFMTHSLKDDIKLREVENAWKPARLVASENLTDEEVNTRVLYKKVRGILNRLTPQKFDTLVSQVQALSIDSYKRLSGVMDLVFEKAVDEPSFSKAYAEMCRILGKMQVPQDSPDAFPEGEKPPAQQQTVNFRKLLINRCQAEFEKNKAAELDAERRQSEIKATKDNDKRKELQLLFEEEERKIRVRSVGLVRFIGELFKLTMLTTNIMHGCVRQLIAKIDEESLECLCKLLMTIGKELEKQSQSNKSHEAEWNGYFDKMAKLAQKTHDSKVSSRVRFMLQDVIELRHNRWVPRRDENNPKTIEQIQKEAERETIENAALLAATPRKHDNRDDRRRNQRGGGGGGGNQNEEGWQSVGSGKSYRGAYPFDTSKLQQMKNTDQDSVLGSSNQFGRWCTGASVKRAEPNKSLIANNVYSVLAAQEDRKSDPSLINTRPTNKVTPSPSLEKERAFQGVKEVMLDNSRNSRGVNRMGGSGPPSRESSRAPGSQQQQAAPPAPPPVAPSERLLSDDEHERKTKTVLEEYKANKNVEETVQCIKETLPGENLPVFLQRVLNSVLDQTSQARVSAGDLIGILIVKNVIQPQAVVKEFSSMFELADDLRIDLPHIWKYLAEILVPILTLEVLNFADFKKMSSPVQDSLYLASGLAEIFKLLIKEKGPVWIRTQWDASKVQLKDFMQENTVDSFVKENNLSFLFGAGEIAPVDNKITMDEVEEKILNFLQADNERVFDHVCDWLKANLGDRTKEQSFICALTKAVIRASTKNSKLNQIALQKHDKLMKRFVDTQEELELACLYGIQNLVVVNMESPQGLLQSIFQCLYDDGTISHEAFMKWRQRDKEETPSEAEGKGVAVTTLSTFFVSLSEIDVDEDGS